MATTEEIKVQKLSSMNAFLRDTVPGAKIQNFPHLIFMLYHQMPPNKQLNQKDAVKQNRGKSLKINCRIARKEMNYSSSN